MKCIKVIITIGLFLIIQEVGYCPKLDWEKEKEYQVKDDEIEKYRKIWKIYNTLADIETPNIKDRYDALGNSGEYGKLQWQWQTWTFYCLRYEGKILDISIPKNQDKISLKKIEELLNKGYSPGQIASFWNCGSKHWKGKKGINRYGQRYDVPGYVRKFMKLYNSQ